MKKKFLQFLSEKIKDFGLSEKAISELVDAGCDGLTDASSDDDIKAKVDSIVPFAKAMQGEFTRKVQEAKQSQKQSRKDGEGEGNKGGDGNDFRAMFDELKQQQQQMNEYFASMKAENEALKAAEAKKSREAKITATAKELGIPDFLMKRFNIADDADLVKELTEFKQDLVTAKLMPANSAGELGTTDQAMKDSAKAWAQGLPDA
jgi:hypothetical protein